MKLKWVSYLLLLIWPIFSFAESQMTAKEGMVVSEHKLASQIGIDILRAGGNAVDAAVAVGYALAVVNPCCGNIGGGGFMLIHLADGKNIVLNFREKAPEKAHKNMYLDKQGNFIPKKSTDGYLAVAIPGTVLGFDTALQKYGTMTRQQVMAPAIKLAQSGFAVTPYLQNQINEYLSNSRNVANISATFFKNGKSFPPGQLIIQNDLAHSLTEIAKRGPTAFYHGSIAKTIVFESKKNGGLLTLSDFAHYNIQEYTPIHCTYRGYDIFSAPPPSSGGVILCEMLNILENFPLKDLGYRSTRSSQIIIETMRYGFLDRNTKLGDPDFVKNPLDQLLAKEYARELSKKIKTTSYNPSFAGIFYPESSETTHYSIVDSKRNAVSVTYSLNGYFGAKIIAGNTGFFLNNEMDDFSAQSGSVNKFGLLQSNANTIAPNKRPLSSMTPTIIMKDGKLVMVLGSPGGPRIISAVLLTLLNIIDYGMNVETAVNAPRFHYQGYPNSIDIEPLAFPYFTSKQLEMMGYDFNLLNPWGSVEAIRINPKNETLSSVNDDRRPDGAALGI